MVLRISLEVGFLSWGLLVWNDLVCCLAVSPFFTFLLLTEKKHFAHKLRDDETGDETEAGTSMS